MSRRGASGSSLIEGGVPRGLSVSIFPSGALADAQSRDDFPKTKEGAKTAGDNPISDKSFRLFI
jgi:hypothetical protein